VFLVASPDPRGQRSESSNRGPVAPFKLLFRDSHIS
jgi:hypothetical protein